MNKLIQIVDTIEAIGILKDPKKFRRHYLKRHLEWELQEVFKRSLEKIKPIKDSIRIFQLTKFENAWTDCYKFNYQKYIKEVDVKFDQLKRKLLKENVSMWLSYNMSFNEFWTSIYIKYNEGEIDLGEYGINDDKFMNMIFKAFKVSPFMIQLGMPRMTNKQEQLKALEINWDT